ncbi:hypothetical protein [Ascidiimonas aurantiaca]|uniref:hypothetical protein n=1 Tax=Ascidiimonas aurantiaca TaxID=1685432 RepID=UPI0030EC548E
MESFTNAFTFFGNTPQVSTLQMVLLIGISFYTFQTLSYTIDVYRGNLKPTKDLVAFASYVSFFLQLLACPIERAIYLLLQFYKQRSFACKKATNRLRPILRDLFKRLAVADLGAKYATVTENYEMQNKILVFRPDSQVRIIDLSKKAGFQTVVLEKKEGSTSSFEHNSYWTCHGYRQTTAQVAQKLKPIQL